MIPTLFDDRPCQLGEGPLWHPLRNQLFWCDITSRRLLTVDNTGQRHWSFDETVSAAGWIDQDSLLIASARGLWRFDISSGTRTIVCPLEADTPHTRSNDGRADPWGGFWVGTMGRNAEPNAGAIYRFYAGKVQQLFDQLTIPNTICFAPDRSCAYFADTARQKIMRTTLDENGWPNEKPKDFVDLTSEDLYPDGAIVDADGCLWVAFWGAARVASYAPDGSLRDTVTLPAAHVTCPAFGGKDLGTLYVTSARQGLADEAIARTPQNGMTFEVAGAMTGLPEPRVRL